MYLGLGFFMGFVVFFVGRGRGVEEFFLFGGVCIFVFFCMVWYVYLIIFFIVRY